MGVALSPSILRIADKYIEHFTSVTVHQSQLVQTVSLEDGLSWSGTARATASSLTLTWVDHPSTTAMYYVNFDTVKLRRQSDTSKPTLTRLENSPGRGPYVVQIARST